MKSAGTEKSARIRVSHQIIEWADLIFVMENKHKKRISEMFPGQFEGKKIVILDIPDEFKYMDEDLIDHLNDSVSFHLDL